MQEKFRLKNTIKYPTSLLVNGATTLGLEIAESLLEQGGYVIIVDGYTEENIAHITEKLGESALVTLLDYSAIPHLEEDVRRLDYVFYLAHEGFGSGGEVEQVSTQAFLKYSNYLDSMLALAVKYEAKFLLTTSIKAHQLLMSSMDLDLNFGKDAKEKHAVYSDMEVQRYAESLTLEYVTKATLNARILRLGEIIGQGMDFTRDTVFVNLILSAVSGRDLQLINDGLDSDWYVHILDAAYGVIKAQFTRDTVGEIYSLAYENTVTHLSLAYKLQELEADSREITFKENQDNLPPLRLHKPAPNLSRVGWRPKIELDQAIQESLASAKLFVLNFKVGAPVPNETDKSVVSKLKSFLALAKQNDTQSTEDNGPVSRLISERKRQEEARKLALAKADADIRHKRKARPRSLPERLRNTLWNIFLGLRKRFEFLRNVTPLQFGFYLLLTILATGAYFLVLSPVVVVGRDLVSISVSFTSIQQGITANDSAKVYAAADSLHVDFTEIGSILATYQSAAKIIAVDKYVSKLISLSQSYATYAEGIKDIAYAYQPYHDYLQRYIANIKFRPNTDSYLSIGTSTDYSPLLDELNARSAYADIGGAKIQQASLELGTSDFSFMPDTVRQALLDMNLKFDNAKQISSLANIAKYGSDLLGGTTPRTYLVVVVDNTRPTPLGGDLSAFALITFQHGAISEARLQSIDSFSPDLTKLPSFAFDQINLHSFTPKQRSNLTIRDLAYVGDYEQFGNVAEAVWGKAFGRTISSVVVINYKTIEDLLGQVGGVDVEGQAISHDSFLSDLSKMQVENATVQRRNDLAAQTLAEIVDKEFANLGQNMVPMLSTLASEAASKNLIMPPSDLGFNLVANQGGFSGITQAADFGVTINMTADPQVISPVRYPAFNQATKITINPDSSLYYTLTLKYPAIANLREVSVCVPLTAKSLQVNGIVFSRTAIRSQNNQQCMLASIVSETELSFSWSTLPIESATLSEYNLSLTESKVSGAEVVADTEINLASGLSFKSIDPKVTPDGNKAVFTQTLQQDQVIKLILGK